MQYSAQQMLTTVVVMAYVKKPVAEVLYALVKVAILEKGVKMVTYTT